MSGTIVEIVAILFPFLCVALFVATIRYVHLAWRNEGGLYTDEPWSSWHGNLASWRGHVRVMSLVLPSSMSLALIMLVPYALFGLGHHVLTDVLLFSLMLPVFVLWFVLYPMVYFFNVPKGLVAPHLRHQPGRISEALGDPVQPTPPPRRYHDERGRLRRG
ncbi:MAG: hypothetical protein Q8O56_05260 [Solirubrobacteraceae bacterium]|nr:hypothetical protein [Solirubrobacteraceae bacterium]